MICKCKKSVIGCYGKTLIHNFTTYGELESIFWERKKLESCFGFLSPYRQKSQSSVCDKQDLLPRAQIIPEKIFCSGSVCLVFLRLVFLARVHLNGHKMQMETSQKGFGYSAKGSETRIKKHHISKIWGKWPLFLQLGMIFFTQRGKCPCFD